MKKGNDRVKKKLKTVVNMNGVSITKFRQVSRFNSDSLCNVDLNYYK